MENGQRVERLSYPADVLRVVIVNALVHRDYSVSGTDITLSIFSDPLELRSPGRLPRAVTVEATGDPTGRGLQRACRRSRLANEESRLMKLLDGRSVNAEALAATRERAGVAVAEYETALLAEDKALDHLNDLRQKAGDWAELNERNRSLDIHLGRLSQLAQWLAGNALVEFLATEQLEAVAGSASQRLSRLTHGGMALEVGEKGEFLIRDVLTGKLRPVRQFSGGETFLLVWPNRWARPVATMCLQ